MDGLGRGECARNDRLAETAAAELLAGHDAFDLAAAPVGEELAVARDPTLDARREVADVDSPAAKQLCLDELPYSLLVGDPGG